MGMKGKVTLGRSCSDGAILQLDFSRSYRILHTRQNSTDLYIPIVPMPTTNADVAVEL